MIRPFITALAFLAFATLPRLASAHSTWIEELPNGQLCVRFAEWGDDFEKSPGPLDAFASVTGWSFNGEGKPLLFEVEKRKDQFFLGKADASRPAFAQAPFAIRKTQDDKPARAPIFYCRWQPEGAGAGTPTMNMDIVPTGKPGEARVYFRGKPLGNVEVSHLTPDLEEKKLKADAEGFVRAPDVSKPGTHLLAIARYSEDLPGFFNGVPYGIASHSASLAWSVKAK